MLNRLLRWKTAPGVEIGIFMVIMLPIVISILCLMRWLRRKLIILADDCSVVPRHILVLLNRYGCPSILEQVRGSGFLANLDTLNSKNFSGRTPTMAGPQTMLGFFSLTQVHGSYMYQYAQINSGYNRELTRLIRCTDGQPKEITKLCIQQPAAVSYKNARSLFEKYGNPCHILAAYYKEVKSGP